MSLSLLLRNVSSRLLSSPTRTSVFSPTLNTPLHQSRGFSSTPACSIRNLKFISQVDMMFDILQRFKRIGNGQWKRSQVHNSGKMILANPTQQKKLNIMVPIKGKRLRKFLKVEYAKRAIKATKDKVKKEKWKASKAGKVIRF